MHIKGKITPFRMLLLSAALMILPESGYAGKYAASFLEIGVGARPLGLGGAYIALSRDIFSFHWNPSGLAFVQKPQFAFMYASQFGRLGSPLSQYNHLGVALKLVGNAAFSVNWVRLSADQIPLYPELKGENLGQRLRNPELRPDGQPLGYFSDQENAYYFTFAKYSSFEVDWGYSTLSFPVEFPVGINIKFIQQRLYDKSASGFGIDLGAMIRMGMAEMFNTETLGKFSIGFQVRDISTTVISWSTRQRDEIKPRFLWGLAYEQPVQFLQGVVTVSWQSKNRFGNRNHVGVEVNSRTLFLRIGSSDGNFTAGTGIRLWKIALDYAFIGYDLGNVHRLSGVIEF